MIIGDGTVINKNEINLTIPERITRTPFNVLIAHGIVQKELIRNFVRSYNQNDHKKLLIHGGSIILLCCEELCNYYSLDISKIPSEKRTIEFLNEKGVIDEATKDYLKAVLNQRENALNNNPINFDYFLVEFLVFLSFIKHTSDKLATKDLIIRIKNGITQKTEVIERPYPELIKILRGNGEMTTHEFRSLVNHIFLRLESFIRSSTKIKGKIDLKEVIDLAQSQGIITLRQTELFQNFRVKRNFMIHRDEKVVPSLLLSVHEVLLDLEK